MAMQAVLYDHLGNLIATRDGIALPAAGPGLLNIGKDYKIARALRASRDGTLRTTADDLLFYDSCEGATVDLANKWIHTLTTQTITQTAAAGILLNASAITTVNTGSMAGSMPMFPLVGREPLVYTAQVRIGTPTATNWVGEWGLVTTPASAITAIVPDGAFIRKNSAGQLVGVLASNGTEATSAALYTLVAGDSTEDFTLEVLYEDDRATFTVMRRDGTVAGSAVLEATSALVKRASVTHVRAMHRLYNGTSVPSAAPVVNVKAVSVRRVDSNWGLMLSERMALMGYDGLTNPTTYAQDAQAANSADPAAAVLSNTVASYTTKGGKFIGPTPTPAAAVTDFVLFGWQNPSPYAFMCTGIDISVWNRGAAVATTATVLEWAMGFNASAVSLATAAPTDYKRIFVGTSLFPIGAAVDSMPSPPELRCDFENPKVTLPGRFLAVILRVVQGTATAAGFLRGHVSVKGFYL